jgi:hypothetical protein
VQPINKSMLKDIGLSFEIYRKNVESLISIHEDTSAIREAKAIQLDREVEEWSANNTGRSVDEIGSIRDQWLEEYFHYKHHFDYLLLHSLYISIFSMFGNHLHRMVEILYKGASPPIKPQDMKGNGEIDTFRKYISLVFGIKSASSDLAPWGDILEYKAIRNALVHSGCCLNRELKPNKDKVRGYRKVLEHDIWHSSEAIYLRIRNEKPLIGFVNSSSIFLTGIQKELVSHVA